jgi:hypothetical protein
MRPGRCSLRAGKGMTTPTAVSASSSSAFGGGGSRRTWAGSWSRRLGSGHRRISRICTSHSVNRWSTSEGSPSAGIRNRYTELRGTTVVLTGTPNLASAARLSSVATRSSYRARGAIISFGLPPRRCAVRLRSPVAGRRPDPHDVSSSKGRGASSAAYEIRRTGPTAAARSDRAGRRPCGVMSASTQRPSVGDQWPARPRGGPHDPDSAANASGTPGR